MERVMTVKTYKDLIVPPPDDVVQRVLDNLTLFSAVAQELADTSSELSKKNSPITLTASHFGAHPAIPLGYYDERRNNVLYVKDYLQGDKLITKVDSVLLHNGLFTLRSYAQWTNYRILIGLLTLDYEGIRERHCLSPKD